jgi:hypothetical protein
MLIQKDGKYFQSDDKGELLLNDKQEPIEASPEDVQKFLDEEAAKNNPDNPDAPEHQDDRDKKGDEVPPANEDKPDVVNMSEDDIAKEAENSPVLARVLAERNEAQRKLSDAETNHQKELDELAKNDKGFGSLYKTEVEKNTKLESELNKANSLLREYKTSLDNVVSEFLKYIPKEKQSLIPADYSAKKKLEYILSNATALNVDSILVKGSKVPKNENEPELSREQTLVKEINELMAKPKLTPTEQSLLNEKSRELKSIRGIK